MPKNYIRKDTAMAKAFKLFVFSQLRCNKFEIIGEDIIFLDKTYLYIASPKKSFY